MSHPALRGLRGLVPAVLALGLVAAPATPAGATDHLVVAVDATHPAASDANPGTADAPVATIARAVALAGQANAQGRPAVVRVSPGTYRESVDIGHPGGARPGALTIEAPHGAVLTGAEPVTGWTRQPDGAWSAPWHHRWGIRDIPSGWSSYWSSDGHAAERDLLRRSETLFDGDEPLRAVASLAALEPGTFHVDEGAGVVTVRMAGDRQPHAIEAAVHPRVLRIRDRADVTVRGLTLQRARGALQDHGVYIVHAERVTLEDVVVRQHAYNGLGTARTTGTAIRRAALIDNGVKGLAGWRDVDLLMEDTLLEGNNWRGWAHQHRGWDVVHKWMGTRGATARRVVSRNNLGRGFWLDFDNQHTTIDALVSAGNARDGIFLERNPGPVTIRNSTFCGNDGPGILEGRSNNVTLADSVIFDNNASWQIWFSGAQSPEQIHDWQTDAHNTVDSRNWRLERNTVVGGGEGSWLWSLNNADSAPVVRRTVTSDGNRWYHADRANSFWASGDGGGAFTLDEWRTWLGRGNEASSRWEPTGADCPLDGDPRADNDHDAPHPDPSSRFSDVPPGSVHFASVEQIAEAGITRGCADGLYCPGTSVSRAQMAAFLARARNIDVAGQATTEFADVPPTYIHRPSILAVAAARIARGCAPGLYCPVSPVTRAQMATFLANALDLHPQAAAPFTDVPAEHVHARAIAAVTEAGIALGCDEGRFCPGEPVTRAQMATFLARALDTGL